MKNRYLLFLLLCLAVAACKKKDNGPERHHRCFIQHIDICKFPWTRPDGSNWEGTSGLGLKDSMVNLYVCLAADTYYVRDLTAGPFDDYLLAISRTQPEDLPRRIALPLGFEIPLPFELPDLYQTYNVQLKNRPQADTLQLMAKMPFRLLHYGVAAVYPDSIRLTSADARTECVVHLQWKP